MSWGYYIVVKVFVELSIRNQQNREMAKILSGLVFALVLSVALHSVFCDDNPWMSLIEQAKGEASKAGLSDDTIFGAEKAVADGSAQKAAEEAMNSRSFNDWVQRAG